MEYTTYVVLENAPMGHMWRRQAPFMTILLLNFAEGSASVCTGGCPDFSLSWHVEVITYSVRRYMRDWWTWLCWGWKSFVSFLSTHSLSFHLNNSSTEISTRKHTRDRKIIIRVKLSFTRIIFVEMANNRVDRFVVKIGQLDYFTSIIQSHANKSTGITTLMLQ